MVRNTYAARPDRFSELWSRLQDPVDVVLARARGKTLKLASTRVGGKAALRGSVALPANECAGLPRGTETVWLARDTLLPLQITSRRGQTADDAHRLPRGEHADPAGALRGARGRQAPAAAQPGLHPHDARARRREGLVRREASDRRCPTGFKLAVSGWAPRSARTGPEASNPRYAQLFAAVYRRGWEHIDVTQRLAGKTGWLGDPFGFECGSEVRQSTVDVNGAKATFGSGAEIVPHLYWRSGNVLYTVSGPFPAATLAAVARSLEPVGG